MKTISQTRCRSPPLHSILNLKSKYRNRTEENLMNAYKTNTDWTRNKNSSSIVYPNADGSVTEINLEQFLKESENNTEEMFQKIKELSDKLFQDEDKVERDRTKNELPFYDWSEKYLSETLEEQFFNTSENNSHEIYLERRKQMLMFIPEMLDKLTETQRRRYLLYKVERINTIKIAEMEKVSQQSVYESITSAEKKIEKILSKLKINP